MRNWIFIILSLDDDSVCSILVGWHRTRRHRRPAWLDMEFLETVGTDVPSLVKGRFQE